jgi:hypothetical protein
MTYCYVFSILFYFVIFGFTCIYWTHKTFWWIVSGAFVQCENKIWLKLFALCLWDLNSLAFDGVTQDFIRPWKVTNADAENSPFSHRGFAKWLFVSSFVVCRLDYGCTLSVGHLDTFPKMGFRYLKFCHQRVTDGPHYKFRVNPCFYLSKLPKVRYFIAFFWSCVS